MEKGRQKVMVAMMKWTEISHSTLEWTLENLRESIRNSKLVIFTVQPISDFTYLHASTHGAAPIELVQSVQENHKKTAEALLEKAKDICTRYGIAADTITEVGDPKEAICEAVEKLNIDLLVLGSHGRKAIQRAFLGNVSNYCVHNAKCPVLVVRKKD